MGIKSIQADLRRRAASTRSATSRRSPPDEPEKKLARGASTRTGGRNHYGRITSRFRGGGHKQRYRVIDFKRDKIGVPAKVATIEYDPEPHGAHRAAPLRGRREALHPRARRPEAGRHGRLEPQRRHQARQLPAAAAHPARHDDPQLEMKKGKGGQLVRSAGVAAQLMAKDGDYAQVKLPSGEVRKVHVDCRATVGQVSNLEHQNISLGKAGRSALARPASAQPRRHHEPGRSPDGRRRRPHQRRSSPVLAVGPARQGSEDPQQQAHRRHDRQAPQGEGLSRWHAASRRGRSSTATC